MTLLNDVHVNKNETINTQKEQSRRPRFSIQKQIIDKHKLKPVICGDIDEISDKFKYLKISEIDETQNKPTASKKKTKKGKDDEHVVSDNKSVKKCKATRKLHTT